MLKFIALGCKVNSYENSALKELFYKEGFTDEMSYDVVVINTCSVTATADQKSRQIIRRERRKNANAILVVMGCYSQKNGEFIISQCKADIVIGTSNRNKIVYYVKEFLKSRKPILDIDTNTRLFKYESFGTFSVPDATRAYIKIQDGCNNFCTYCTIPSTRGIARSRDKQEIIDEISYLIDEGYLEFVLTGIHTAHYGIDNKECSFSQLVESIVKIPNLYRLRISSIEESEIDAHFIQLLKEYNNIANHLHMPLQSGSPTVLKRMGRKYNVDDFIKKVNLIREVRPDISITTDVIVGFPGETDDEFRETVEFIKNIKFAELHVFPFSAREGTKAFDMANQVSPEVKENRVRELLELSKQLEKEYRDKFINKDFEVILEERNRKTGLLSGFTSNYIKLSADLPDSYIGKISKIKVR